MMAPYALPPDLSLFATGGQRARLGTVKKGLAYDIQGNPLVFQNPDILREDYKSYVVASCEEQAAVGRGQYHDYEYILSYLLQTIHLDPRPGCYERRLIDDVRQAFSRDSYFADQHEAIILAATDMEESGVEQTGHFTLVTPRVLEASFADVRILARRIGFRRKAATETDEFKEMQANPLFGMF